MNRITIFAAISIALLSLAAHAQQLKPGQYEYATKTEVMGMTIPVSFKQCVTQKDIDSNDAYVNKQGMEGCTPPVVKRSGAEITIKYACTKPKLTAEGKGSVSADTFTFDMKVIQHEMNNSVVRTSLAAKRIGDCQK
jgi:hypothetical protein